MNNGILFGMGNPLLDISATVSIDLLKKYNLKENDAILAEESHAPLFDELSNGHIVDYIPGGATQNAIKVAQWMIGERGACVFTGCIKDDHYGQILEKSCEKIGVKTVYEYHDGEDGTGLCACLISGHNRSLVTRLGAACMFKEDFFDRKEVWKHVETAKFYYISSFFITSCHAALMRVAKHSLLKDKTFCLNLGAPFLVEFFHAQVVEAIEHSDFVFGNETEALKMSEMCKYATTDIALIASKISEAPFKKSTKKRTVIITQGPEPVIVVHEGVTTLYPVVLLKSEDIVDTNGAGDAFVGGFLSQLIRGKSLEECVRGGQWASKVIIQRAGCTFPEKAADFV